MPIVDAGSGERGGDRVSAEMFVKFVGLADEIIDGKDGKPDALKVLFKAVKSESTASYAIPIGEANRGEAMRRLRPFTIGEPAGWTESALRQHVASKAKPGPFHVRVWGDYVQEFKAGVGVHVGYLTDLRLTKKGDRVWFTLESLEGLTSEFSTGWPPVLCTEGETPAEDSIGGDFEDLKGKKKKAFSPLRDPFHSLIILGLDWKRLAGEDGELMKAPALWPRMDLNGEYEPYINIKEPFPPQVDRWCFFSDPGNLTPELLDAVYRHGRKPVSWTVYDDPEYGLSVKRGDFFFELNPVPEQLLSKDAVAALNAAAAAFHKEAFLFSDLSDKIAQKIAKRPDARFMINGKFSDEGRDVGKYIIKPLLALFPEAVREVREDGSPVIALPPTPDKWKTNGLVCLDLTFQRLLALPDDDALFLEIKLAPDSLYKFVNEHVQEWAGAGLEEGEGGELL